MPRPNQPNVNEDCLRLLRCDKVIWQRLAKFIALQCFRNTKLEDLHAGTSLCSVIGDYIRTSK